MNVFDKVRSAAKQFEQMCEELETFMLPQELKEKVNNIIFSSSRLVHLDRLLMKMYGACLKWTNS